MLVLQAVGQIEEHVNHTLLQGGPRYFANLENILLFQYITSFLKASYCLFWLGRKNIFSCVRRLWKIDNNSLYWLLVGSGFIIRQTNYDKRSVLHKNNYYFMILMEVFYRFKLVARRPYRLTQKLSNGWALKSAEHLQSLSTTR